MLRQQVEKFLVAAVLLQLLICASHSQDSLPAEIVARDHGKIQKFVVSTEEIARKESDGRFQVKSENAAIASKNASSSSTRLILYPAGEARTEANTRLLTEKILIKVLPQTDIGSLAEKSGTFNWKKAPVGDDQYLFFATSAREAISLIELLRQDPQVIAADFLLARRQTRRAAPNDPLFARQWYLQNKGQTGGVAGIDPNVVPVWGKFGKAGNRGSGVIIGIIDDGVQYTHPDIAKNYNTAIDYDWNDQTPNDAAPSARNEDFHGTSVAGVAAAVGNNRIGVCGVAPEATLTGLRLIADYVDDSEEAEAFLYRSEIISIKNNSWGPNDDGETMEAPGPLAQAALAQAVTSGRNERGTIFMWAAGNGREYGDNSNYDGYANSIHTIAVTAVNDRGNPTYYGEGGANVLIATPSDQNLKSGIVTTDLTGQNGYNYSGAAREIKDPNYTQTFGGTSSATPVAAGVVALMLQQKPTLGWRDVQEILIRTARKVSQGSWTNNSAGFHFNSDLGAGLIDATAAVKLAANWTNLGMQVQETQSFGGPTEIPDGTYLERPFTFSDDKRVEHVTVKLKITHPRRGQLKIYLISPSLMVSELAVTHDDPNSDIDWTYMTVRHWGENSGGTWKLQVWDPVAGSVGTLDSADLTIFGSIR